MSDARAVEELWWRFAGSGSRRPPPPRVTVDMGACIPTWGWRIAYAVVALGCTLLVASHGAHWVIAGALIATMLIRPSGAAPALFAVGVGLLVLASEPDPFDPRVFLLALGLHLTVQLAAVVGDLPWLGLVELRVLVASARPFLAIQAGVQAAALIGAWTTSRQLSATWLPVLAGIGLAGMAWTILLRLRADSDRS